MKICTEATPLLMPCGTFAGLCLRGDTFKEHASSLVPLCNNFGIALNFSSPDIAGDARTRRLPTPFRYEEFGVAGNAHSLLITSASPFIPERPSPDALVAACDALGFSNPKPHEDFVATRDGANFAIRATGQQNVEALAYLADQFRALSVLIVAAPTSIIGAVRDLWLIDADAKISADSLPKAMPRHYQDAHAVLQSRPAIFASRAINVLRD